MRAEQEEHWVAVMEQFEIDWKDYYEILQVSPNADAKVITASYERLADLYHHLLSEMPSVSALSQTFNDIKEAYDVLSDPVRRASYDRVFMAKCNSQDAAITEEETIPSTGRVAQDESEGKRRRNWGIPRWGRVTCRAVLIALILLLAIFVGGTSFAFAQPQHTMATPFRGAAITVLKAPAGAIGLIEDIRGVVAGYERNTVYTSLQSMRVVEGLRDVPPVKVPTNDMTRFPSPQHPLFPNYLDKKVSQFKYTVDSDGVVTVHTSGATTDSLLEKIEQLLHRLEEAE